MAADNTADEKVLEVLKSSALPMVRSEIAKALGWSKQRVAQVLLRLVQGGRVVCTAGDRTGSGGRPAAKYAIKVEPPVKTGTPPPVRFERHTIVVTPSNREARVLLHRKDGFVELEYLDGPRTDSRTAIHESLLRAIRPSCERPHPVLLT